MTWTTNAVIWSSQRGVKLWVDYVPYSKLSGIAGKQTSGQKNNNAILCNNARCCCSKHPSGSSLPCSAYQCWGKMAELMWFNSFVSFDVYSNLQGAECERKHLRAKWWPYLTSDLAFWEGGWGKQCHVIESILIFALLCYALQLLTFVVFLRESVLLSSFFFTVATYVSCKNSLFYLPGTQTCSESAGITLVKNRACILELAGPLVLLIVTCVIKSWLLVSIGCFCIALFFHSYWSKYQ